jgi:hypothetical protein
MVEQATISPTSHGNSRAALSDGLVKAIFLLLGVGVLLPW